MGRQPPLADRALTGLRGLVLSGHLIPSLAVTALSAGLAGQAGTTAGRGALVTAAVLTGQLSIGWSNDALDAERDRAVGRTDKPVAAGTVGARSTMLAAVLAVLASTGLSLPLGWAAAAAVALVTVCGWAYNLGLKATRWSWLPYAVAFGTLPGVATFSSTAPRWPAPWAAAAGALLGVAAHFANVLPDLRDDRATGVRGLPHRLGAPVITVVGPLLLVAASAVILFGQPGTGVAVRGIGAGVTVLVAGWAIRAARRDPASRRYFLAVIAIALLDLLFLIVSAASL